MKDAKLFSLLLLLISTVFCGEASDCYSLLTGDTLKIGNDRIERVFLWNNGNLMTCEITDKRTGKKWASSQLTPDFTINRETATDGRIDVRAESSDDIRPDRLLTIISFRLGELEVERTYRIYDGVPAIAVDTRLKGRMASNREKEIDNSDRSNIEHTEDSKVKPVTSVIDRLSPGGNHWKGRAVEFRDITDWNDNLVDEKEFISYRKTNHRGNVLLLTDLDKGGGFVMLKEAPCSGVQLAYKGADFITDFGTFMLTGLGMDEGDVSPDRFTDTYSSVICTFGDDELSALEALRAYQKQCRILDPMRDEMIMMNTWGDRSQDSKVTEEFCLAELERGARLGITIFQIDDGWQAGKSPNSKTSGGSFRDIYAKEGYWTPDTKKYPRGLTPVTDRARELGIEVGLWFNPSIQDNFADWEKDAAVITDLWRDYGIRYFKIDGLTVNNKEGEENLRKLFDKVLKETDNQVVFNLDATASRRLGYHYFNEYGNIFLENRYTDWGNYYPFHTLRNLWMLSKYVPAEKLQIEFLNKWRNEDKYRPDDRFAPSRYEFDYLFALTMAGQPLAWMESSNLPEKAFELKPLIDTYREIQHDFHCGTILPVGDEPSGSSWTGFQSITDEKTGYLLIFREDTPGSEGEITTWFAPGSEIRLTPIAGSTRETLELTAGTDGRLNLIMDSPNSFILYKYVKQK